MADELSDPGHHKYCQRSDKERKWTCINADAKQRGYQAEEQHPRQAAERQEQVINRCQDDEDGSCVKSERKLVAERGRNLYAPKQPYKTQRNQRHANEVDESVRLILMELLIVGN